MINVYYLLSSAAFQQAQTCKNQDCCSKSILSNSFTLSCQETLASFIMEPLLKASTAIRQRFDTPHDWLTLSLTSAHTNLTTVFLEPIQKTVSTISQQVLRAASLDTTTGSLLSGKYADSFSALAERVHAFATEVFSNCLRAVRDLWRIYGEWYSSFLRWVYTEAESCYEELQARFDLWMGLEKHLLAGAPSKPEESPALLGEL